MAGLSTIIIHRPGQSSIVLRDATAELNMERAIERVDMGEGFLRQFPASGPVAHLTAHAVNVTLDADTEAQCLADDLERAGNDWGAQVVRRLAGITPLVADLPVETESR